MIEIRHAKVSDKLEIKSFLKKFWNKEHILVKNDKVFDHLYLNKNQKTLQFFLGLDTKKNICGLLGYIKNSQYDDNILYDGAWLALWKVRPNLNQPLGMQLLNSLENNLNVHYVACLGINKLTLPIYKKLGYISGETEHLFFEIKNNYRFDIQGWKISDDLCYFPQNTFKTKSTEYLKNKFINTEFYDYKFFSIHKDDVLICQLVGRILFDPLNKTKIFRIVDYLGYEKGISAFAYLQAKTKLGLDYIDIFFKDTLLNKKIEGFTSCTKKNLYQCILNHLRTVMLKSIFVSNH